VEPISVVLLVALAGGAGGELGRQAWAGLSTMVRRPFQRVGSAGTASPVSGEAELAALERAPDSVQQAQALLDALTQRAAADPLFASDLSRWSEQARAAVAGDLPVRNMISGGVQHGPVLQGRDFSGPISFGGPPSAPSALDGRA
jgi:hypothetical protein